MMQNTNRKRTPCVLFSKRNSEHWMIHFQPTNGKRRLYLHINKASTNTSMTLAHPSLMLRRYGSGKRFENAFTFFQRGDTALSLHLGRYKFVNSLYMYALYSQSCPVICLIWSRILYVLTLTSHLGVVSKFHVNYYPKRT